MGGVGRELKVTASPFGIETGADGYGLEECGFTAPVLADQEGNRPIEIKGLNGGNGRNVEWIDGSILDSIPEDFDFDKPATHSGHAMSVLLSNVGSSLGMTLARRRPLRLGCVPHGSARMCHAADGCTERSGGVCALGAGRIRGVHLFDVALHRLAIGPQGGIVGLADRKSVV